MLSKPATKKSYHVFGWLKTRQLHYQFNLEIICDIRYGHM